MSKAIQIIKGRLFWFSSDAPPRNISNSYYFSIDEKLIYENINNDFGPIDLGKTWKYVTQLEKLLAHPQCRSKKIFHLTSKNPENTANSAYLIGAFQVMSLGLSAEQAFEPFLDIQLKPFRDSGYEDQCDYQCTVLDCLKGLQNAIKLGWFHYKTFNLAKYEYYQKMENGDISWVIPNKFIAFSEPSKQPNDKYGNKRNTTTDYVPIFKRLGVAKVIRLSYKTYQANDFVENGIKHEELFLPDKTLPSIELMSKFFDIAEKQKGALAVHCKAGLGRTGTLIACYALKHYYFPAAAFIGWIRIVRPGSIIGNQQNWLIEMQGAFRKSQDSHPIYAAMSQPKPGQQNHLKIKQPSITISSSRIIKYDQNNKVSTTASSKLLKKYTITNSEQPLGQSKSTEYLKTDKIVKKH